MHRLFTGFGGKSFYGKTTVLLIHEFSTVIDIIYNLKRDFNAPKAMYLENSRGVLTEKGIEKDDVQSFSEIAINNMNNAESKLTKLIYLRRYLELNVSKGPGYQLLSNYLHRREKPVYIVDGVDVDMNQEDINKGQDEIREWVANFGNYRNEVGMLTTERLLAEYDKAENNYEKLHFFRSVVDIKQEYKTVQKFINETYHIENDYLFQLNPLKYEIIPEYIIDICDKSLISVRDKVQLNKVK